MKDHDHKYDVEALFHLARGGDGQAWGQLFTIYVDDIYRYAYVKLGNTMDAQDVAAETFKKVWLSLRSMHYENFRAYLYRVAHNVIVDTYRTKKRITVNEQLLAHIEDERQRPEENIEKKQDAQVLYDALRKLPKEFQDVLQCRFMEDLSVKETASILHKSQIWVRVAQYRATKKLRNILSDKS